MSQINWVSPLNSSDIDRECMEAMDTLLQHEQNPEVSKC